MFVAVDGALVGKKLWTSRVEIHSFHNSTMLGQTRAWVMRPPVPRSLKKAPPPMTFATHQQRLVSKFGETSRAEPVSDIKLIRTDLNT
jgi:hypothetical protein